jgi:hypothetical protein
MNRNGWQGVVLGMLAAMLVMGLAAPSLLVGADDPPAPQPSRMAETLADEQHGLGGSSPLVVPAAAFSSDGNTVATASELGEITLWDLNTLEERMTVKWEGNDVESSGWLSPLVRSLAFSPDGRTLVSSDGTARVWLWQKTPMSLPGPTRSSR